MKIGSDHLNWEKNVRKTVPYTPGEQPGGKDILKLNTNENPYPPSPAVKRILDNFDCGSLRLYPSPDSKVLTEAIASGYGVDPSRVFVGVGSDDVLSMAFLTFFNSEKPVLFPDVTYSFYDVWAGIYRIPFRTVPLDENFGIIAEDYMTENGGIVFPNPNAPTGILEDVRDIERIIAANPDSVVIIDEAYIDFGGQSCLPLTEKYDNLLVVQTFSKSRSLAGLRIGFAVGNEKLIKYMNDVRYSVNSYTMNTLSQTVGAAAVADEEYFRETTEMIINTRERSEKRLAELGFTFTDSKSNFLFASHRSVPAKEIFEKLRSRGIYVRYWDKPRISDYLRITIGKDEDMNKFFAVLEEILNG